MGSIAKGLPLRERTSLLLWPRISKVTEPFFRVDRARSRDIGGVGLGLAICKQIVDVHGAKMTITSAPGKGTTVKILFTAP